MTRAAGIDPDHPCWTGYRELLRNLEEPHPGAGALTALLQPGTTNLRRMPIRFVGAAGLDVRDYEKHIYETGEVSTREGNWHDLFNAFAWCRFPHLKAAMNALHYGELGAQRSGRRGPIRDALTLLDESGVIVYGTRRRVLEALAARDWTSAFIADRESWGTQIQVVVCGHAILEKILDPYKSVTAHALLLHTPGPMTYSELDRQLAGAMLEGALLESTASLSPLPLMGVPGWWPAGEQDAGFYRDRDVFRPDSGRRPLAPVHALGAG